MLERLRPLFDILTSDEVLFQAWKKSSAMIRERAWFADPLAWDYSAVNVPRTVENARQRIYRVLDSSAPVSTVRLVSAPKSSDWSYDPGSGWVPRGNTTPLRPLADVRVEDQVVYTAIMMCMADLVERRQGDPEKKCRELVSLGHRLQCYSDKGALTHRWASRKVYRSYYQDYRSFLLRSDPVPVAGTSTLVYQTDISSFYDRVSTADMRLAARRAVAHEADAEFEELLARSFEFAWSTSDRRAVASISKTAGVPQSRTVALPQGLASAGFFSNVLLSEFDDFLKHMALLPTTVGASVVDAFRYVDDIRVIVQVSGPGGDGELKAVTDAIDVALDVELDKLGLKRNLEKTSAAWLSSGSVRLLPQGRRMSRIQSQVSGGFDATEGAELLDGISTLVSLQRELGSVRRGWDFSVIPDVKTGTVERFAANRYRAVARTLRPMLVSREDLGHVEVGGRSVEELDQGVMEFSAGLLDSWTKDPSKARLMRIALAMCGDPRFVKGVGDRIESAILGPHRSPYQVAVGWYTLVEFLRGVLEDRENLAEQERDASRRAALDLVRSLIAKAVVPWYAEIYILYFLLALGRVEVVSEDTWLKFPNYYRARNAMLGIPVSWPARVVAYWSFGSELALDGCSKEDIERMSAGHVAIAREAQRRLATDTSSRRRPIEGSLAALVAEKPLAEITIVEIAIQLVTLLEVRPSEVVRPDNVLVTERSSGLEVRLRFSTDGVANRGEVQDDSFAVPNWCDDADRLRVQLGYLVLFMMRRAEDLWDPPPGTRGCAGRPKASPRHRSMLKFGPVVRIGDPWAAISDWMESFCYSLLRCPGGRRVAESDYANSEVLLAILHDRRVALGDLSALGVACPLVPIDVAKSSHGEGFHICILQTASPTSDDLDLDPELVDPVRRRLQKIHLAKCLALVRHHVELRRESEPLGRGLDLLVLPELSVRVDDIETLLIPVARKYRIAILAGVVYDRPPSGVGDSDCLVNSACWVLPVPRGDSVSVRVLRQGKQHLAREERQSPRIVPYRPVQWLVRIRDPEWVRPLVATASICFDATDLPFVGGLRDISDLFLVPAFNRDVDTYDTLARALGYHLYQYVVVANCAEFGGSGAFAPLRDRHSRRVFHVHGANQVSVGFVSIDDVNVLLDRSESSFRTPPAGARPR